MDAFFASVEQLDNPGLKGKPVAVGGNGPRSVVAAASYEARKFGVRSAMPAYIAKRSCPSLILVPPRFDRYKEISVQIRSIFKEFTDEIEPLSLDEAYLDVSYNKKNMNSAIRIAKEIKTRILETTGLTASAGVSINKFLAKTASDIYKPDGLSVILPEDVQDFIDKLPIEKFYGVGKSTAQKMNSLGIYCGHDLRKKSEIYLIDNFGKMGRYLYQVSRGKDDRKVESHRIRKSVSVERTYDKDLDTWDQVQEKLDTLIHLLHRSLVRLGIRGKTVNLKVRYSDFVTFTRSKSIPAYTNSMEIIHSTVLELFENLKWNGIPIRLLGIGLSNLDSEIGEKQMEFEF